MVAELLTTRQDCPMEEPFQAFLRLLLGYPSPLQVGFPVSGLRVSPAQYEAGMSGLTACSSLPGSSPHSSWNISAAGLFPKCPLLWPPHGPPAIITPGWLCPQRDSGRTPRRHSMGPWSIPLCRETCFLVESFNLFCEYLYSQVIDQEPRGLSDLFFSCLHCGLPAG